MEGSICEFVSRGGGPIRRDGGGTRAVLRPHILGVTASVRQPPHGYVNRWAFGPNAGEKESAFGDDGGELVGGIASGVGEFVDVGFSKEWRAYAAKRVDQVVEKRAERLMRILF